jgi:hypothetical protein
VNPKAGSDDTTGGEDDMVSKVLQKFRMKILRRNYAGRPNKKLPPPTP